MFWHTSIKADGVYNVYCGARVYRTFRLLRDARAFTKLLNANYAKAQQ